MEPPDRHKLTYALIYIYIYIYIHAKDGWQKGLPIGPPKKIGHKYLHALDKTPEILYLAGSWKIYGDNKPFLIALLVLNKENKNTSNDFIQKEIEKINKDLSKIEKITSPLLIISGKKDEIVPHEHSIKLFDKAKVIKERVFIDEAIHNNLYDFGIEKDVIDFNLKIWKCIVG